MEEEKDCQTHWFIMHVARQCILDKTGKNTSTNSLQYICLNKTSLMTTLVNKPMWTQEMLYILTTL